MLFESHSFVNADIFMWDICKLLLPVWNSNLQDYECADELGQTRLKNQQPDQVGLNQCKPTVRIQSFKYSDVYDREWPSDQFSVLVCGTIDI